MNWYFASGDLGFFWEEQIQAFSWLPQVWKADLGYGLNGLASLWLDYPFRIVMKLLSTFGLSWFFVEKLLWVLVFTLAIYSSYKLTKSLIGTLIYSTNTYFLLLFAGGQLGVALAYALSPLVLMALVKWRSIRAGLLLALLVLFDLRIAYLVIISAIAYGLRSVVPLLVAASVHLYWILPTIFAGTDIGEQFTNPGMLKFLSFADFSHAISLLHPNWPENLFGKVYFMQPEFLVIPILAFVSLLFVSRLRVTGDEFGIIKATVNPQQITRNRITYFTLLALIGSFFAKGVNEPFGEIYRWMFLHIPGFVMFRDPTKFYLFTAIGYSVLIPFVLSRVTSYGLRVTGIILFIIFWIFTLRGFQLPVAFMHPEYIHLKNLLVSDPVPSRTLWIPQKEGFAYFSDVHPILTATDSGVIDSSVKYIIVPPDVNRRIFLDNYTFDPSARQDIIEQLQTLPLKRNESFRELAVFENTNFTRMQNTAGEIAHKQQRLAHVGTVLSAITLVGLFVWLIMSKRKP